MYTCRLFDESKAYRVYNPETKKLITRRDVVFDENSFCVWKEEYHHLPFVEEPLNVDEVQVLLPSPPSSPSSSSSSGFSSDSSTSGCSIVPTLDSDSPPLRVRSLADVYESCIFVLLAAEPINFEEAQGSKEWHISMKEWIASIEKNNTWVLVDLPPEKDVIGVKWVYRMKHNADGSVQKFISRLVAKGYVQKYSIDYLDTFSHVARLETVRIILALAAQMK